MGQMLGFFMVISFTLLMSSVFMIIYGGFLLTNHELYISDKVKNFLITGIVGLSISVPVIFLTECFVQVKNVQLEPIDGWMVVMGAIGVIGLTIAIIIRLSVDDNQEEELVSSENVNRDEIHIFEETMRLIRNRYTK